MSCVSTMVLCSCCGNSRKQQWPRLATQRLDFGHRGPRNLRSVRVKCIHGWKPRTGNGNDMVGEIQVLLSNWTSFVHVANWSRVVNFMTFSHHTFSWDSSGRQTKQAHWYVSSVAFLHKTQKVSNPPMCCEPLICLRLVTPCSWPVATWAPMDSRSLPCRFLYRGRQLSSSKRTHCWRTCLGWYMPRLWCESNGGSNLQPFEGHRHPPTPRRGVFKHIQLKHRKQIPSFDRKANETSCGWSP